MENPYKFNSPAWRDFNFHCSHYLKGAHEFTLCSLIDKRAALLEKSKNFFSYSWKQQAEFEFEAKTIGQIIAYKFSMPQ